MAENKIQTVYDRMADEEREKLKLMNEKRKQKGRPEGNRGLINTVATFIDIHDLRDSKKDADKRSDAQTQRWG